MSSSARPLRLLFVAPHFPPTNAPDGQRLRILLPEFVTAGCECTVLSARPEDCLAPVENELMESLPTEGWTHHQIAARAAKWGVRNIGLRIKSHLGRHAEELLKKQQFDVVYFSTTQFACLPLALDWLDRFGLPYVIDLQDPWVNDYYERPGAPPPPGGWKHRFARWAAQRQEPRVLRRCSHLVSVSADYVTTLSRRYAWFKPEHGTVIPFGWSVRDQLIARAKPVAQSSKPVIRYIGRVGDDMAALLDKLFAHVAIWKNHRASDLPLPTWEFIGTSYAGTSGGGVVQAAAARHGLSAHVSEQPERIGYFDGLARLQSAWANLVLGSDDLGYSPSKTWPLLATGRPWLAMTHSQSVIHNLLPRDSSGGCVLSDHRNPGAALGAFLDCICREYPSQTTLPACLTGLASTQLAKSHLEIFNRVTIQRP
ncbi:glycosyltransferase [Synoicihabitans lomoniglobus]|uniref:Glycosyltransferase n=1 Tax=Synoicihabitans lomoniglobus TaxID=2909285 RepID=A0AAF0CSQ5_9BACT|nr:glycosyltransferase [Opitutaceae bacterium LMO-M01]WED67338.1 glycosyltransferase [Opitutaceae bacterium LMO-M01]